MEDYGNRSLLLVVFSPWSNSGQVKEESERKMKANRWPVTVFFVTLRGLTAQMHLVVTVLFRVTQCLDWVFFVSFLLHVYGSNWRVQPES